MFCRRGAILNFSGAVLKFFRACEAPGGLFIGHYAAAFVLIFLFPQVPVWVPLVGVSFPDLLWSLLVLAGKEEVVVDKDSPLQKAVVFKKYPYSHSLVLTNVISIAVGGALAAVLNDLTVLPVFVMASASHWVLDTVVHLGDLPVLGFDGDRKVGLGLWRWGRAAFLVELLFFVSSAVLFVRGVPLLEVLAAGLVFHLVNANSFLGFSKKNPFASPRAFAVAALFGFGALTAVYSLVL